MSQQKPASWYTMSWEDQRAWQRNAQALDDAEYEADRAKQDADRARMDAEDARRSARSRSAELEGEREALSEELEEALEERDALRQFVKDQNLWDLWQSRAV